MYDFCSLILNTPITWIQTNFYSDSPLLGMTDNGFLAYTATELHTGLSLYHAPKERNVHILMFLLSEESVSDLPEFTLELSSLIEYDYIT